MNDMFLNVWASWDDITRVVAAQSPHNVVFQLCVTSTERLRKKVGPRTISVLKKLTSTTSTDGDGERGGGERGNGERGDGTGYDVIFGLGR